MKTTDEAIVDDGAKRRKDGEFDELCGFFVLFFLAELQFNCRPDVRKKKSVSDLNKVANLLAQISLYSSVNPFGSVTS